MAGWPQPHKHPPSPELVRLAELHGSRLELAIDAIADEPLLFDLRIRHGQGIAARIFFQDISRLGLAARELRLATTKKGER